MRFPSVTTLAGAIALALSAPLTATHSAAAGADQATKLWEATGLTAPESALPDVATGVIYVSNIGGGRPDEKDGNGFITKLSNDGKVTEAKWVTGLNAPKGLALHKGKLYVGDIDQLVEIDVKTGAIAARYPAAGAKILNDVAADSNGRVYATDWTGNAIWRLSDGTFEKWLESAKLNAPNGILVGGDKLVVASWGSGLKDDFSTETPGNLLTIRLADKAISNLGAGTPVGNLDGLASFDAHSYLATDWVSGKVFQVLRSGEAKPRLSLGQGTADLAFIPSTCTAVLPLMAEGKVVAYKLCP